jgi:Flp pilus assembly protein TadG
MNLRSWTKRFASDQSGVAAVEFAIVAPLFLIVVAGVICYGGYFWMSHSVQQLANDSARAAIAGLDASERRAIAQQSVKDELGHYPLLQSGATDVVITDEADALAIKVSYDASNSPFYVFSSLIPMPSPSIGREAAVRLGGY